MALPRGDIPYPALPRCITARSPCPDGNTRQGSRCTCGAGKGGSLLHPPGTVSGGSIIFIKLLSLPPARSTPYDALSCPSCLKRADPMIASEEGAGKNTEIYHRYQKICPIKKRHVPQHHLWRRDDLRFTRHARRSGSAGTRVVTTLPHVSIRLYRARIRSLRWVSPSRRSTGKPFPRGMRPYPD